MATAEEENAYWSEKVETLRRTQLETVQKAATNWAALFGSVLGIYGVVAFAGGLTSIDKLPDPWATVATALTVLAAGTGLVATYLAARAAGDLSPGLTTELAPDQVAANAATAASIANGRLHRAKAWGFLTAVIVLVGSTGVLLVGEAPASKSVPTVLAVVDGRAVCGELEGDDDLSVAGTPLVGEVASITIVTKCPGDA